MAQETNRVILDPNSYANVIKMILRNFLEMKVPKKSSDKSGSLVIDIQLLSVRNCYVVQITHCGRWTDKNVGNLLDEFYFLIKNAELMSQTVLAYLFERANGGEYETVYQIKGEPDFERKKIVLKKQFVHFPSFKNYIIVKLQYRLSANDLLEFKGILLREFDVLTKSDRNVKIIFYFEKEIFYNNTVGSDIDFQDCKLLSSPLIAIIKQSMNNNFKERCLDTLGVNSAHDAEKVLSRTLFSMIHENYMTP